MGELITSEKSQREAVELSWTAEFVGQDSLKALELHIQEQMLEVGAYAHYCSIVQSSGMGKSRLLDEFGKRHFLIPVNLRPKDGGFPPADHNVRKFLSSVESNPEISFSRACHFLKALFCTTTMTIKDLGTSRANRIEQFRAHMSKGQSMDKTGTERRDFYEKVILMAMEGMTSGDMSDIELLDAFQELQNQLNGGGSAGNHSSNGGTAFPDIFIMFDEAHPLTEPFDPNSSSSSSNFAELQ